MGIMQLITLTSGLVKVDGSMRGLLQHNTLQSACGGLKKPQFFIILSQPAAGRPFFSFNTKNFIWI
jgi:hypothetical protein